MLRAQRRGETWRVDRATRVRSPGASGKRTGAMPTPHDRSESPGPDAAGKPLPSRSAAAQRRAMQAALTAAVTALRSQDGRRGRRPPSQGLR